MPRLATRRGPAEVRWTRADGEAQHGQDEPAAERCVERTETERSDRASGPEPAPGAPGARRWSALARLVPALLGLALLQACSVPRATARQGLDYGFRSPEQAIRSWRTAVQEEALAEEYKCLSKGWRARNGGVSLFNYAEAREQLLERYPQLPWALHRAGEPEILAQGPGVRVFKARIDGPLWFKDRWLVLRTVREAFWEVWTEDLPYQASYGAVLGSDDVVYPHLQTNDQGGYHWIYGVAREDDPGFAELEPEDVQLVRMGYQWKIDRFEVFDEIPTASGELILAL